MTEFLGKVWALVRPYKNRLILGLICSVLFALSNALLMLVVKLVPDVLFAGPHENVLGDMLQRSAPKFLRDSLLAWPPLQTPHSTTGLLLAISTLPLVMLLRGLFAYL